MNSSHKKRLGHAGWRVGTADEFLGLSREEAQLVDLRLALSAFLKRRRQRSKLTQQALALRLQSSQSRIAKLESGADGATLDLLFRALFATGVTTEVIVREMSARKRSAA